MSPQDHLLTVGEYTRSSEALADVIDKGFSRMDKRFDGVQNVLTDYGERIAVLEAGFEAGSARPRRRKITAAKTAGWGSAAAGTVLFLYEAVKTVKPAIAQLFTSKP
jgi:hypothetical protein